MEIRLRNHDKLRKEREMIDRNMLFWMLSMMALGVALVSSAGY